MEPIFVVRMNLLKYSHLQHYWHHCKVLYKYITSALNPLILQTGREKQERKEEGKEGSGL